MDKEQALNNFWNRFGWTAYDENTVPDNAEYPYITYNVSTGNVNNSISLYAQLWDRSTSWKRVVSKSEEIAEYIGYGHHVESFDDGYIYITMGNPFAQRMSEPGDDKMRRIYISVNVEFLCKY